MAKTVRWGVVLLLAAVAVSAACARSRQALWGVVHLMCVPDHRLTGLPIPCTMVDRRRGVALVKDIGATGYLLVPTRRISGVEDARLLAAGAPNYWQAAWDARPYVTRKARRPLDRAELAMAVNAIVGRSQDQLHIHLDCVRRVVGATLRRMPSLSGGTWARIELPGGTYHVRALDEAELAASDPFALVAARDPAARAAMGAQTIALVGAWLAGRPGFYLLAAQATPLNHGHAEDLLDHGCGRRRAKG